MQRRNRWINTARWTRTNLNICCLRSCRQIAISLGPICAPCAKQSGLSQGQVADLRLLLRALAIDLVLQKLETMGKGLEVLVA